MIGDRGSGDDVGRRAHKRSGVSKGFGGRKDLELELLPATFVPDDDSDPSVVPPER